MNSIDPKKQDFFERVFDVVRLIPHGRVSTYGAIAAYLGAKRSARMVGWAMNLSHQVDAEIPAHRVVNRVGILTGKHHFKTPTTMREKLLEEGIMCDEHDQIINFNEVFWDPFSLDNL